MAARPQPQLARRLSRPAHIPLDSLLAAVRARRKLNNWRYYLAALAPCALRGRGLDVGHNQVRSAGFLVWKIRDAGARDREALTGSGTGSAAR